MLVRITCYSLHLNWEWDSNTGGRNWQRRMLNPVIAVCFEEKLFYAAGSHWKHNVQPAQVVPAVPS